MGEESIRQDRELARAAIKGLTAYAEQRKNGRNAKRWLMRLQSCMRLRISWCLMLADMALLN